MEAYHNTGVLDTTIDTTAFSEPGSHNRFSRLKDYRPSSQFKHVSMMIYNNMK